MEDVWSPDVGVGLVSPWWRVGECVLRGASGVGEDGHGGEVGGAGDGDVRAGIFAGGEGVVCLVDADDCWIGEVRGHEGFRGGGWGRCCRDGVEEKVCS